MATSRVGPGKMVVTLYLTIDLVKRIDRIASARDLSRSKYIEQALESSITDDEVTVQALTDPVIGPAFMSAFAKPEVLRAMSATLKQDLNDEQLSLFQRAMAGMQHQVQPKKSAKKKGKGK